jgi:hypothetical protein
VLLPIIVAYFVLWISRKGVEKIAENAKLPKNPKSEFTIGWRVCFTQRANLTMDQH